MTTHARAIALLEHHRGLHLKDAARLEERLKYRGRVLSEADTPARIASAAEQLKAVEEQLDDERACAAEYAASIEALKDAAK